ncbi:hypothetical protein CMQ_2462 [Grosmannia clavigera kw1407]|uniref:Tat pathway signal sequence n=1 Tax=Grosmannia clavigera (strain kw1407 / UAMH 11150) TaxID=655863 RepID=F0XJI1_GROCL|nr:uncharacterized protein CMQ_2462 [Grosmannia clavigera kw1407]EFX02413.1 hypothetical protein CMQ_2462 [Grosmannia clavigera kw1407]
MDGATKSGYIPMKLDDEQDEQVRSPSVAPLLDNIDLGEPVARYEINELFNRPYTIYRGAPSDEVDAAWDAIAEVGIVLISGEDVRGLGKDPSRTVKAPPEWDAHLAQIDGQHQIHCLNVLRKWGHYDYYFRPKFGDDPGLLHNSHRDHCVMLLLQTLTCQPSLDLITHNWVETQQYPVPDFNMNRKCKSHDRIIDWQRSNMITMDQWDEIRPQPGDFFLPLWPELVEINKQNGWNGTR